MATGWNVRACGCAIAVVAPGHACVPLPCSPDVSQLSQTLHDDSKRFHWGARKLNLMEMYKKYLPFVFVILLVLFVGYMYW